MTMTAFEESNFTSYPSRKSSLMSSGHFVNDSVLSLKDAIRLRVED